MSVHGNVCAPGTSKTAQNEQFDGAQLPITGSL